MSARESTGLEADWRRRWARLADVAEAAGAEVIGDALRRKSRRGDVSSTMVVYVSQLEELVGRLQAPRTSLQGAPGEISWPAPTRSPAATRCAEPPPRGSDPHRPS
jgi:hypothetical protein